MDPQLILSLYKEFLAERQDPLFTDKACSDFIEASDHFCFVFAVCRQVHGHDRAGEPSDAIKDRTAARHERITGYATLLDFFGHVRQ